MAALGADTERRFGGLRRLYGDAGYDRLRQLRAAVVGLGGVGSWAAEALARSGIAQLVLIDLDHVAESNINRQVQAVGQTVGLHKGEALKQRIADIHPDCDVQVLDAFVEADNWPGLIAGLNLDGVIDACDQVRAKAALAAWARRERLAFVTVGAAGGKQRPELLDVADLSDTTHDPLLASLRARLRREHGAPRQGRIQVRAVFSRESVQRPEQNGPNCAVDGTLNCAGYGSSVMVTASFGLAASAEWVRLALQQKASTLA
ncbi:tRNA threonylcarbamoyladenosine dehydratase [Inhella gelatinilytica]|uniref:tRNA threonylcarbamoyladenosine dehydratase n=1 Tax=Inhella gelatinilytica TaxID=2795030 RepID=A0A931NEJ7_9BURK|nr:tRNA threonylcarbamoyladenosine dehydratase [Inhella gelatinilytica]MBH9552591.1 tRNA threonylcarbamoyladenosine dehydratase [Inhella gelatinilytica]